MSPEAEVKTRAHPRGTALVLAMTLIILLGSFAAVLVSEMDMRSDLVEVDLEDMKAFEAAEAGIDAALADINLSPAYQPRMTGAVAGNPAGSAERRASWGIQPNPTAQDPLCPAGSTPLKAPDPKPYPIYVHVRQRADGTKPGCLGTSDWTPNNDYNLDGRPTWKSVAFRNLKTPSDPNYYFCEPHVVPQILGDAAFFTYAIDWFHDGVDNDRDGFGPGGASVADNRAERNKYTVYATGIHVGRFRNGITEAGRVVTLEVNVQAMDDELFPFPSAALEVQVEPTP
jgi:hypothetical protein